MHSSSLPSRPTPGAHLPQKPQQPHRSIPLTDQPSAPPRPLIGPSYSTIASLSGPPSTNIISSSTSVISPSSALLLQPLSSTPGVLTVVQIPALPPVASPPVTPKTQTAVSGGVSPEAQQQQLTIAQMPHGSVETPAIVLASESLKRLHPETDDEGPQKKDCLHVMFPQDGGFVCQFCLARHSHDVEEAEQEAHCITEHGLAWELMRNST
ncbi:hypothetical protein B0H13DRAFT_1850695 [Mycena leptocephala]|nr:hypothetical protein B0H13DRAFT_1850695 [Mycena leptocephala]